MKHIRLFENFKDSKLEKELKKYGIKKYTINSDGTIDVDGIVDLYDKNLNEIPFKFGRVSRDFNCSDNKLKSLEGCPYEVGGNFYSSYNQLTSLNGSPMEVGGDFNCANNQLTSLNGSPIEVGGNFHCYSNYKLANLEGMPLEIGGNFYCPNNPNLKELDSISNIEGNILCDPHVDITKFKGYCKKIITE